MLAVLMVSAVAHAQTLSDDDYVKMYLMSRIAPEFVAGCADAFPAKSEALKQALSEYLTTHREAIANGASILNGTAERSGRSVEILLAQTIAKARAEVLKRTDESRVALCRDQEASLRRDSLLTPSQLAEREFDEELIAGQFGHEECDTLGSKISSLSERYLSVFSTPEASGGYPPVEKFVFLMLDVPRLYKASKVCADLQAKGKQRGIAMPGEFLRMHQVMTELNHALGSPSLGVDAKANLRARDAALQFVSPKRTQ